MRHHCTDPKLLKGRPVEVAIEKAFENVLAQ
jgi:hypothetical protein